MFGIANALANEIGVITGARAARLQHQAMLLDADWQYLRNQSLTIAALPKQNVLTHMPRYGCIAKTRSNRVISDLGFGGAESRPRSRRYANG